MVGQTSRDSLVIVTGAVLAGALVLLAAHRHHVRKMTESKKKLEERLAKKLSFDLTKETLKSPSLRSWSGPRKSVTVRVPATTANMGPGFDSIGMALDIWSEVTVERSDKFIITCEGEGAAELPKDQTNLVCVGVEAAFKAAGQPVPTLKYHCVNRIPFARGLGSSSAAIVGGIIAGLVLAGHELPVRGEEGLLQLAAEIEGHPDNVAPAIYGGIQLGILAKSDNKSRWFSSRVPHPSGLQCVLFIPNSIGKTSEARAILPEKISRKDAVHNIGRVAMLVNALCNRNLDELHFATEDVLHQPQRGEKQFLHLFPMIEAAKNAGAHGCFLSGAGPTVLAITSGRSGDIFTQRAEERTEYTVAEALRRTAKECGVEGSVFITSPVDRGARIVHADPNFSTAVARFEGDIRDL